jgi:Mrp family chromosome partitioning ATPase
VLAEIGVPARLAGASALDGAAGIAMRRFGEAEDAALGRLATRLTALAPTGGRPSVHLVFGTAAGGAVAAVAYGLARALAKDGAETLLIDANGGAVTTGATLIGPGAPGILDAELDDVSPDAIAARLPDASVVLLPAASPALREAMAAHGGHLVETIEDVADGFERIVLDVGAACPPALFGRLADIADDLVMVVDAGEADAPSVRGMYDELKTLVPGLRGMVAVRPVG